MDENNPSPLLCEMTHSLPFLGKTKTKTKPFEWMSSSFYLLLSSQLRWASEGTVGLGLFSQRIPPMYARTALGIFPTSL